MFGTRCDRIRRVSIPFFRYPSWDLRPAYIYPSVLETTRLRHLFPFHDDALAFLAAQLLLSHCAPLILLRGIRVLKGPLPRR
jgi:hypothetical protein